MLNFCPKLFNRLFKKKKEEPMFHAAVAIIYNDKNEVLLLKRSDDCESYPGHWNFPGGGPENDETPEQCVSREVFEETSLMIKPEDFYFLDILEKEGTDKHIWFFIYEGAADNVEIDEESSEYKWVKTAKLSEYKMIPTPDYLLKVISIWGGNIN
ncbi:hypothetical protein CMI47_00480 [Candidatus Pacearchaeota archaeon]|nr:hypothetical protein [Candidatus Pacearchaeota archaeon]|tara:strand:- start:7732 stop:8196 length:465 start_codon:yes stop_codon:yes gene_type:complete